MDGKAGHASQTFSRGLGNFNQGCSSRTVCWGCCCSCQIHLTIIFYISNGCPDFMNFLEINTQSVFGLGTVMRYLFFPRPTFFLRKFHQKWNELLLFFSLTSDPWQQQQRTLPCKPSDHWIVSLLEPFSIGTMCMQIPQTLRPDNNNNNNHVHRFQSHSTPLPSSCWCSLSSSA